MLFSATARLYSALTLLYTDGLLEKHADGSLYDEVRRKTRKGRVGKEVKRERDASEAHLASRRQSASAAGAAAWRRRRREMNPTKLFFSRLCEKCHIVCNGRFHIYKRRFDSASSALDGSPECRQLSPLHVADSNIIYTYRLLRRFL